MQSFVVIVNAEGVVRSRINYNIQRLTEEGLLIVDKKQLHISSEQLAAISPSNATDFTSGPIVALLVRGAEVCETFKKIYHELDNVYGSSDEFAALRDRWAFFPPKPELQRTIVIVKPGATKSQLQTIQAAIQNHGFVKLREEFLSLPESVAAAHAESKEELDQLTASPTVVFLLERHHALDQWRLVQGPSDADCATEHAPNSLRAKFASESKTPLLYCCATEESANQQIATLFFEPLAVSRTVALLLPRITQSNDAIQHIYAELAATGFTVQAQSTVTLTKVRAEHFLARTLPNFFSTHQILEAVKAYTEGPILSLLLAKPAAVSAWQVQLGAADGTKPNSLLAKYHHLYRDLPAFSDSATYLGAVYGSASDTQADQDAQFFFPQLTVDTIPDNHQLEVLFTSAPGANKTAISEVLLRGLTELSKASPPGGHLGAVQWLGEWLLRNNPNPPVVSGQGIVAGPVTQSVTASSVRSGAVVQDDLPSEDELDIVFVVGAPHSESLSHYARIASSTPFHAIQLHEELHRASQGGPYSAAINKALESNQVVSTKIVLALVIEAIHQAQRAGKTRLALCGFPQTLDQAMAFEREVVAPKSIFFIDTPDHVLQLKLGSQGAAVVDDAKLSLRKFYDQAVPVVQQYSMFNKVKIIHANGINESNVFTNYIQPSLDALL